jgi:phosphoglycerol transferase MdoB-like AlkP superfamily enzyme
MKSRIKVIGLLAIYWMTFFVVGRILFLVYHGQNTGLLSFSDIVRVLTLGLRMDAAMAGYWLILPCLLLCIPYPPARWNYYSQNIITITLLLVSTFVIVVDLELYTHWGFRMNTTPLFYIGRESIGSVNTGKLIGLIVVLIGLLGGFIFLYLRLISRKFLSLEALKNRHVGLMLLLTAALIIPIRSSFTVAPLNTGVVYFHKTMAFPNHAGINVVWNFFLALTSAKKNEYPKSFYPDGDPISVLTALEESGGGTNILRVKQPNVIMIIMESFTAKIIEPLGGLPGITPELNGLVKEGILFDNIYSSGDRTDKGLVAILSAFPAQPTSSIIKFPDKTLHLSYLSRAMQETGYHTSFVYGGDIGFANMNSYLTQAGFSHITADGDFDGFTFTKWGVPDEFVFTRLGQECDTAKAPFFKVMLSLSSHEPFDIPGEPVIEGTDERSLFLNSCHYSDKSLGAFIREARKQPWWDETLIVVTADHGHHHPDRVQELKEKQRFRIPLLLLGGALAVRDTVVHTMGGQTDIANTLLTQIDRPRPDFHFSKNLLSGSAKPFAVYVFHNGYGFVDTRGETIYDFDFNSFVKQEGELENVANGKAYMQALFNAYNSY